MHIPVLLNEVIEYLDPKPGGRFIDATFGAGGHGFEMAKKVGPGGSVLGIEATRELYETSNLQLTTYNLQDSVFLVNDNFVNLKKIVEENNFGEASGILFDFGLSSWHLEQSGRGFSFQKDEPLDMRMVEQLTPNNQYPKYSTRYQTLTAEDVVNKYSREELIRILKEYGEERFAKPIAEAITKSRKDKPIGTTFELVEIIKSAAPRWYTNKRLHFATKTFQALRIEVNNELDNIKSGLKQAEEVLKHGGRLVAVSFHALEDRIVKSFLREGGRSGKWEVLTKKPITPSREEVVQNPRARSAKLRAAKYL